FAGYNEAEFGNPLFCTKCKIISSEPDHSSNSIPTFCGGREFKYTHTITKLEKEPKNGCWLLFFLTSNTSLCIILCIERYKR
ncbi:MAG TPA: hypothetical protein DEQ50_03960, partial [Lactobacillus sp.]|nr:hypothetical protein [Lactobacillus sp.]